MADSRQGLIQVFDYEPAFALDDDLGHGSSAIGDHRSPASHGFDDAEAERLIEADQMEQGSRPTEDCATPLRAHRSQVGDHRVVEVRLHFALEIRLVLDDPCHHQRQPGALRHLDGLCRTLLRVDPPEEEQIVAGRFHQFEGGHVDPVVDRRQVVEAGMAV